MTAIKLSVADVNGIPVGPTAPLVLLTGQPTNSVTLSLTCVGADTTLKGGAIVPQDSADGPASLYLGFSADTFTNPHTFNVAPPAGWNCQWLDTPYPVWALAPGQDVTLANGTSLFVTISGIGVIALNEERTLTAHLDHTPPHHVHKSFKVIARKPGTDLTNIVDFGFDDDDDEASRSRGADEVFISNDPDRPIENKLVFHLSNLTQAPLVSQPWETDRSPTFTLSFVTAAADDPDAAGALTTPGLESNVHLNVGQTYSDLWKHGDRVDLSWSLLPQAPEVLGTGAAASVQFDVTGIESWLPEGLTWAYLTYTHVPGYSDGFLARPIQRRPPVPAIKQFVSVTPYVDSGAAVQLQWKTFGVRGLKLSYTIGGLRYVRQTALAGVPGQIELNQTYTPQPPPIESTDYILQILDESGAAIRDTAQHTVRIGVKSRPAVINSFIATPNPGPAQNDAPYTVTLKWDVEHATQIELQGPGVETIVTGQKTWTGLVRAPATFFLRATGEDGKLVIGSLEVIDLARFLPGKTLAASSPSGMTVAFYGGGQCQWSLTLNLPSGAMPVSAPSNWQVAGNDITFLGGVMGGPIKLTWRSADDIGYLFVQSGSTDTWHLVR